MNKKVHPLLSLILLVSVILSASAFSCNYDGNNYFEINPKLKVLQERTFNTSNGNEIKIEASMGDITISSWEKKGVYIKVLGNDKANEKLNFYFEQNSGNILIKAKKKGSFTNWFTSGIHLKFEIKVPVEFNTKSYTSGGDIKIESIKGNNILKTSGGDISLNNIVGNTKVSTSGGDIIANKIKGDLDLNTSGGDITFTAENSKIIVSTSGGDIVGKYSGKNLGINLRSSGGDIVLKLPTDFNASARLITSGGDVVSNLNLTNVEKKSNSKIIADINNGGELLKVKTSGGDISVVKQ